MKTRSHWKLSAPLPVPELVQQLPGKMDCRSAGVQNRKLIVLDDFFWHVWESGALLTADENAGFFQLWQAEDKCLEASYSGDVRFWWELPDGKLAQRLRDILSLHAFVPKFSCALKIEELEVLNPDKKIVCRIKLFTLSDQGENNTWFASLTALRGYHKDYLATAKALQALSTAVVESLDLRSLLQAAGLHADLPFGHSGFLLAPDEPAEIAVCKMARSLLVAARQYEQGMIDDIDTEFVHQYRINIRKARSLVTLFKRCLTAERYCGLRSGLKTLAQQTNELRDLDVFLLDEEHYRRMLPDDLQAGFSLLYRRIKRRRKIALQQARDFLQADSYQTMIDSLFSLFDEEPGWARKQAQMPIKELVCLKVMRQYRQICTDGRKITGSTPDEAVHELRIECKKLRYLLELFTELFAQKKVNRLIKHLKKLQDNLGRFNDCSVQREFLGSAAKGRISTAQRDTLNGLAAVLYNRQLQERSLVEDHIDRFIAPSVAGEFQELFADNAGKESVP